MSRGTSRGDTYESSPAVEALLAMARAAPPEAVAELERAVRLRLEDSPTLLEDRLKELGALSEILRSLPASTEGEDPAATPRLSQDEYERLRPADAPSARVLSRRHGSWPRACRAADSMLADGRVRGPGLPWRVLGPGEARPPAYTREECIAAYRACALSLGRRPSSFVYDSWLADVRRRRRHGAPRRSRVPDPSVIYRLFGSWPEFAAAAPLTDAELDGAWRFRLCVLQSPQPEMAETAEGPHARLRRLRDQELADAGFSEQAREQLLRGGVLAMALGQATALAHALGGSLDWLAGRTNEPSPRAPAELRFDAEAYKRLRRERGVPEDAVLEALDWTLGQLRRVMTGRDEPSLGALVTMASLLGVEAKALCRESNGR